MDVEHHHVQVLPPVAGDQVSIKKVDEEDVDDQEGKRSQSIQLLKHSIGVILLADHFQLLALSLLAQFCQIAPAGHEYEVCP